MRMYIIFARGKPLRFLSHLDMMRLWERALRRAGLPLCYSQGYHPHPRLSLALPLSVGMTAEAEWLEVEFASSVSPEAVWERLQPQLPAGLSLQAVREAPPQAPPLAAQVRGSEVEVEVPQPPPPAEVQERIRRFLEAGAFPVEEEHKGRPRVLDLRPTVETIEMVSWSPDRARLRLRLKATGRPTLLLRALGLGETAGGDPPSFHRRRLFLTLERAAVEPAGEVSR
ncbi:MAG: TIGR03936 family radical SAM-associated protein [Chloroflexia bacterium]